MKHLQKILIIAFTCLTGTHVIGQDQVSTAATQGQLNITVTTSKTSTPTYSPRHILAIYVLDSQGKFVKTLMAYAGERKQYLVNWRSVTTVAGSVYNTVDAITGATQQSHTSRTCTWNSKNRQGVIVEDGTYTLRMELTDNDGKAQNMASFNFTKGTVAQTITPANTSGFSNISIQWQPSSTSIDDSTVDAVFGLFPNPVSNILRINVSGMTQIEIFDVNGKLLITSALPLVNLENLSSGNYIAVLTLNNRRYSKHFIKL